MSQHFSVRLNDLRRFKVTYGESLLDAALRQTQSLPYSCRVGRCGSCKCKLLAGQTMAVFEESGLEQHEIEDGWILSCARTALSDIDIESEEVGALPSPQTLPCRIDKLERLSIDVMAVTLRLPPKAKFQFLPGQYIEIIGPDGIRRSYSLANSGGVGQSIELHIRRVQTGHLSRYWFERACVNDLLRLHGPLGTFFLRPCSGLDLVFLATGTGIAPIRSILQSLDQLDQSEWPSSVALYWGGRSQNDLYMPMSLPLPRFRYIPVLSRPSVDWSGGIGYVQNVAKQSLTKPENTHVYACGSEQMIHDAKRVMSELGVKSKYFYSDAFVSTDHVMKGSS